MRAVSIALTPGGQADIALNAPDAAYRVRQKGKLQYEHQAILANMDVLEELAEDTGGASSTTTTTSPPG